MHWGRGRVGEIQKAGNWSTQIPEESWFWRYSETVVPMYLYSTRKRGRRARLMTMSSRRKIGYCHKRAWHASPCCSLLYFAPFCPFRESPYCIFHLHMASDFDKELRAPMFSSFIPTIAMERVGDFDFTCLRFFYVSCGFSTVQPVDFADSSAQICDLVVHICSIYAQCIYILYMHNAVTALYLTKCKYPSCGFTTTIRPEDFADSNAHAVTTFYFLCCCFAHLQGIRCCCCCCCC